MKEEPVILTITWPSGATQTYRLQQWLAVTGERDEPYGFDILSQPVDSSYPDRIHIIGKPLPDENGVYLTVTTKNK